MWPRLILLLLPGLFACEPYSEPSDPVIFMGGGKWIFIDYDIVIVNSITPVTIIKNDTICISSFHEAIEVEGGTILKQDYNNTDISRRFVRNNTQWEFDGYNLYCEWVYTPGGMKASHEPFWVSYPNMFYTNYNRMSILDNTSGTVTNFTFETNNTGVNPPNELILVSPEIVINLYSSGGARDKAVTFKVILKFLR